MWFEEALFYLSANGKGAVVLGQEVGLGQMCGQRI